MTDTITREGDELVFREDGRWVYVIDLDRCTTSAQVLDWIVQVSKKRWATPELIGQMVRLLDKELDLQHNICSRAIMASPDEVAEALEQS